MAESFVDRWRSKEHACGLAEIAAHINSRGPDFLPESAAPCVAYKEAARPVPIWETFAAASDWSPADRERLAHYRVIGSDGAGNPICIKQDTGTVVLLNHENWFHTCQFVNSSVRQLAECLLAYMGEDDPVRFRSAVRQIDSAALAENSFWWHEAVCLDNE
jgi:SUKH-4 immunity protein